MASGDVFGRIKGTTTATFQVGNATGANIKAVSGALEIRNAADSAYETLRADKIIASGAAAGDIPTLFDLQSRHPVIGFSFSGGTPPSPGANTGKYGICHTTGGGYTLGNVVYDPGSVALVAIPAEVCRNLTTEVSVSGTLSMIQYGNYALQSGAWTLTGDGTSSSSGTVIGIKVPFTHADANAYVESTTSIPSGASVLNVRSVITEAFDNPPVITAAVQGSSPVAIVAGGDIAEETIGEYHNPQTSVIGATGAGKVRVSISDTSPTTGEGYILVEYVTPLA
jgi:hypothetical protein